MNMSNAGKFEDKSKRRMMCIEKDLKFWLQLTLETVMINKFHYKCNTSLHSHMI